MKVLAPISLDVKSSLLLAAVIFLFVLSLFGFTLSTLGISGALLGALGAWMIFKYGMPNRIALGQGSEEKELARYKRLGNCGLIFIICSFSLQLVISVASIHPSGNKPNEWIKNYPTHSVGNKLNQA